eukprot:9825908-Lingulodinium_polyedra.AAC.1
MAGQGCHSHKGHQVPLEESAKAVLEVPLPLVLVDEPLHKVFQSEEQCKAQPFAGGTHCKPPALGEGSDCQVSHQPVGHFLKDAPIVLESLGDEEPVVFPDQSPLVDNLVKHVSRQAHG